MTYQQLVEKIAQETGRNPVYVTEITDIIAEVMWAEAQEDKVETFLGLWEEGQKLAGHDEERT